jgi:hypothetical protein
VRADLVALDSLAGGVVLEHHPRRVEADDRVDVVRGPGGVVARDQLFERLRGVELGHAREYRSTD